MKYIIGFACFAIGVMLALTGRAGAQTFKPSGHECYYKMVCERSGRTESTCYRVRVCGRWQRTSIGG